MSAPKPAPPGSTCQETSLHRPPLLCGEPAAFIVQTRDPAPYVMCAACADHNVKNRGARLIERGERHKPIAIIEPRPSLVRSEPKKETSSDALARMSEMGAVLALAQNKIAIIADQLAAAQKEAERIEREDLPQLMKELKLAKFTLEDGSEIELLEDLKCGISEANRPEAHDWVRAKGDGGIIKTVLAQEYGRGEEELAATIAEKLRKLSKHDVNVKESIHPSTLKSYINEQRAKGINIPEKLFGIHITSRAKLTPPKERKSSSRQKG